MLRILGQACCRCYNRPLMRPQVGCLSNPWIKRTQATSNFNLSNRKSSKILPALDLHPQKNRFYAKQTALLGVGEADSSDVASIVKPSTAEINPPKTAKLKSLLPPMTEENTLLRWTTFREDLKTCGILPQQATLIGNNIKYFQEVRSLIANARREHNRQNIAAIRNNPKFLTLTSPDEMKAKHRKFVKVPPLGALLHTKGFGSIEQSHMFISDARLSIWQKYYHAQTDHRPLKIIPSGPYGIGKSAIGLLLASTAFMLRKPLLYYPNLVVSNFNKKSILDTIYLLNADLLNEIPQLEQVFELYMRDTTLSYPIVQMSFLSGSVFIMDEHHRFLEPHVVGQYEEFKSFQEFQSCNLCMYIGSAHSQFESNLGHAWQSTLEFLAPFSWEEFLAYLEQPESPVKNFPLDTVPGNTDEEKKRLIYENFKLYRLIGDLHKSLTGNGTFLGHMHNISAVYLDQIKRAQKHGAPFDALIKRLCEVGANASEEAYLIYDCGMIYKSHDQTFYPTNFIAKNVFCMMSLQQQVPVAKHKSRRSKLLT